MEPDKYIICMATDPYLLMDMVNRHCKVGYDPIGGIAIEPKRNGDEPAKYFQTMVKALRIENAI